MGSGARARRRARAAAAASGWEVVRATVCAAACAAHPPPAAMACTGLSMGCVRAARECARDREMRGRAQWGSGAARGGGFGAARATP